jgi:hypothetical protein
MGRVWLLDVNIVVNMHGISNDSGSCYCESVFFDEYKQNSTFIYVV